MINIYEALTFSRYITWWNNQ